MSSAPPPDMEAPEARAIIRRVVQGLPTLESSVANAFRRNQGYCTQLLNTIDYSLWPKAISWLYDQNWHDAYSVLGIAIDVVERGKQQSKFTCIVCYGQNTRVFTFEEVFANLEDMRRALAFAKECRAFEDKREYRSRALLGIEQDRIELCAREQGFWRTAPEL